MNRRLYSRLINSFRFENHHDPTVETSIYHFTVETPIHHPAVETPIYRVSSQDNDLPRNFLQM